MKKQVLNLRPGTGTISASIDSLAARASTAVLTVAALGTAPTLAQAQDDAQDLAKKLSNPVAALISVPLQFNYDEGFGPNREGHKTYVNFQPVVPMSLNADWNVISRTIVPFSYVGGVFPEDVFGIGDTAQSFFFSPKDSGIEGFTWGVGPEFLLPTATDADLGTGKWGIGPTAVVLYQWDAWSVGMLANHVWSVAGDEDRDDVSQTFLQPFVSYALGEGQTLTGNFEATYDWYDDQWSVPANLTYSKVFKVGDQSMSWVVGGRAYLVTPDGGPEFGIRSGLTFLFPEKGEAK